MTLRVLPDDSRLWDVQEDARLYLAHAVFFLVALVVVFIWLKLAVRGRR